MALGVADDVAQALADDLGRNVDEVRAMLRGLDESQQRQLAESVSSTNRLRDRVALRATDNLSSAPADAAESAAGGASRSALYLGGGAAAGSAALAGGYVGNQYLENQNEQAEFQAQTEQRQFLQELLNSSNLTEEQKQNALQQALDNGLFSDPTDDEKKDGSLLGGLLPNTDLFGSPIRTLLIVIVVYMIAKGMAGALGNVGSGSGGGA